MFFDQDLFDDVTNAKTKEEEAAVLKVRLTLAQAYSQMMGTAFDALLHYDVNFRELGAYTDTTLLDEAQRLPLLRGQEQFIEWMARVEHDIAAAIRRKSFRQV